MKFIKLITTAHVRFMASKHAGSTWFNHVAFMRLGAKIQHYLG